MSRKHNPHIDVTQEHIDSSTRKDSSHCMIAEAIKDTIPEAQYVSVDLQTIRLSRKGTRYIYLTPRSCQLELLQFDEGISPAPFRFRLPAPSQTHQAVDSKKRTDLAKPKVASKTAGPVGEGDRKDPSAGGKRGRRAPVKKGGQSPPHGPLAGGASVRTGKIRRFGLRSMGRAEIEAAGENENAS